MCCHQRQIDCSLHVGGAKRSLDPSTCRQFPPAFVPPRRRSRNDKSRDRGTSRAHASRPRPATWQLWRPLFLPAGRPPPPSPIPFPFPGGRRASFSVDFHTFLRWEPYPSPSPCASSSHATATPAGRLARRGAIGACRASTTRSTRFVPSLNSAPGSASRTPGS
jgi:hypothetical protein